MDQHSNIKPIKVPFTRKPQFGDWTEKEVLRLVELYIKGDSMGAIGNDIGKTRNAVAGQISKIRKKGTHDLAPRAEADKSKAQTRVRLLVPIVHRIETSQQQTQKKRIRLTLIESPTAVTLIELQKHHCKYPLGDPKRSDFRFCGGSRLDGSPYCAAHTAIATPSFQQTDLQPRTPQRTVRGGV